MFTLIRSSIEYHTSTTVDAPNTSWKKCLKTKGVIRNRNSKDRQYNAQKKKDERETLVDKILH